MLLSFVYLKGCVYFTFSLSTFVINSGGLAFVLSKRVRLPVVVTSPTQTHSQYWAFNFSKKYFGGKSIF